MPIKSFRGILTDGAQERIRLKTLDGKTGYKIKKFELFPQKPGQESVESTVLVWTVEQSAPSTTAVDVDFSNQELIGAACFHDSSSESNLNPLYVVFDNVIFNQDIYITHTDTNSSIPINYYLEVEQIHLDDAEATAVILKNFRNTNSYAT